MKLIIRPAHAAFVLCGLLLSSAPAARAGDIFCGHRCFDHDGKMRSGVRGAVGGAVYLPVSAPAGPATVGVPVPIPENNPLATAHEAELAMIRHQRAKAALKAEIEATNKILQRISTESDCSNCPKPAGDLTAIERQLKELNDSIMRLDTRLTSVEKLLLTHDAFIQEAVKTKAIPQPKPAASPDPKLPEPMK